MMIEEKIDRVIQSCTTINQLYSTINYILLSNLKSLTYLDALWAKSLTILTDNGIESMEYINNIQNDIMAKFNN